MTDKDIFRLDDVSDVPQEVRKHLSGKKAFKGINKNLLDLLNCSEKGLSIDELVIGYYRKFGEIKTRTEVVNRIGNLCRYKGINIQRVAKGVYKIAKVTK